MIGVRVLGPLEVTVDGARANLGGPRQRCVLARLIAAQGAVVSADRLIEDLYADEAPPKALAGVQAFVSHLRRVLEPGRAARGQAQVLVTSPPGYAVHVGRDAVDAWSFEDEVYRTAGQDDPATVYARLSAALASWHGVAFQEFGGLPWADTEASRLEQLRLLAAERRADAALRLGRAAQIVADLDRLTAEQPLREEAWRLLALALYQSGRQGDALAALRRARARLAEDLGVDPGPALRDLEDGILAQDPRLSAPSARSAGSARSAQAAGPATRPRASVTAPAAPVGGRQRPAAAAPYVGRDAELGQVTRAARQAAAGRVTVVLVAGEAGAGKTALAGHVSQRLAAEGWTVTVGRCPEHEGAPAGWPWAEALRHLARTAVPADPHALAPLLTDTDARDGDAAAARFRLHRAVVAYLASVSAAAPLLVVLDDVHRADGETLAILTGVTADLAADRVLIVAGYRPAEVTSQLSGALAALAAREPVRVTLGGLDPTAAAALIRATCTRPVDGETAQIIAMRTGGNPFFVKETARLLDSEGTLAAATAVPAGVREVLQRRIARMPAAAQTIMRQAAVIGMEADIDVLSDVAGVEEHVLLDAIDAALLTGLVTEPAPGRIRFAHALVRDTLYQGLSRLRRSRLHAQAGRAIEKHCPGEVAALAYHFSEAGTDPGRAARYCGLAAGQAEQRFAYHEAARLWERAIACLEAAGEVQVRDRLELMLGLIRALIHTGQLARARSCRRDAVSAALPLDDPDLLARVITAFDEPVLWSTHDYDTTDTELVDTVERTLIRLPPGDQPLRCRLLTSLAFELQYARSERGAVASIQAVEMARRLGDPAVLALALNGRHYQSFRHDGLAERRSLGAEMLAVPGKPVTAEAVAHLMLARASSGYADFDTADAHAGEAARIAGRYDLPAIAGQVTFYRAMRAALRGDEPAARDLYQQAAEQVDRLEMWRAGAGMAALGWFCLRIMQDRATDIAAELDPDGPYIPNFAEVQAFGLVAMGRVAEARAVAARPFPIIRDIFWLFLTGIRGLLAVALDDRERAAPAYTELLPYAARPAGAETGLVTLWPVALILGDLARYLGLPGVQAHYRHALAVADRARVDLWRQAALRRLG